MQNERTVVRAQRLHRRSVRQARTMYGDDFANEVATEADDADYFDREEPREDEPDSNATLGLKPMPGWA